jgi:hypothetical protein
LTYFDESIQTREKVPPGDCDRLRQQRFLFGSQRYAERGARRHNRHDDYREDYVAPRRGCVFDAAAWGPAELPTA